MSKQEEHRDLSERPADRRVERSTNRALRWMKIAGVVAIFILLGVIYTIKFHSITQADANNASCKALHKSLHVLNKYIIHQEGKSIENVEKGITSATTSVPEIEAFIEPTLEEIHNIKC